MKTTLALLCMLLIGCAGYDVSISGEYTVPGAKEPIRVTVGRRFPERSEKDAKEVQPVQ